MATLFVKQDGSGDFLDIVSAIAAASNGDIINIGNGTYSSAGLNVNKELKLIGESQSGVLLQDSRGNSQTFMNVSVNNVTLENLTVRHVTSDSSIGHAIVASGGGFPQIRLNNFKMINVKSQYSKGGLAVRSDNFLIEGCTFEVVAGSSTRRGILHYGNGGESVIKNCHFINVTTSALRAICPTSTSGSNPSDNQAGKLTIEGSTFSGNLSQFVNIDNHQGAAGAFELIVQNNVTPETNAFVVSFGAAANFGDVFSKVTLINNTLTNNHSSGLGKGVFAVDGIGPVAFRSSPLPITASGNVLGQLQFRAGYVESVGSTGSISGYATAGITLAEVSITGGEVSNIVIVTQETAEDPVIVEYEVDTLKAIEQVSNDPVFSNEENWRLIGFVYKHTESSKRLYVGVRKTNASKPMKLRQSLSGETYELDKAVLFDLDKNALVIDKENISDVSKYDITLK
jgi:hypothetical protein